MKKHLLLFASLFVMLSTFAAPWDMPSINTSPHKVKSFDDPYVTSYGVYVVGHFWEPNYAVNIQISFDHSVPAPYYAVIQVLGLWGGSSEATYREFTILFNTGQWSKSINFPMHSYEEAYTTVSDLLDYGPQ